MHFFGDNSYFSVIRLSPELNGLAEGLVENLECRGDIGGFILGCHEFLFSKDKNKLDDKKDKSPEK